MGLWEGVPISAPHRGFENGHSEPKKDTWPVHKETACRCHTSPHPSLVQGKREEPQGFKYLFLLQTGATRKALEESLSEMAISIEAACTDTAVKGNERRRANSNTVWV